MSTSAVVLYENKSDGRFNLEYFTNNHMPLVMKQLGDFGLKSFRVVKFEKDLQGSSPTYTVAALLDWESPEAVEKAMSSEMAKTVFADVPNFTNIQPVFLIGGYVGGI